MTFLQSLILGIIQGLTEFLPVSSSAHLVLVPYLLGWTIPESQVFPFDVLVQIGTLVAVIIYFWRDLLTIIKAFITGLIQRKPFEDPNSRLGWYLILATIPAGLAGLLLKSKVEAAFNSPRITAYFLFGTAVMLVAAEFFSRRNRTLTGMKWYDALWIGFFQAISIFPGISRSGSTITGGMTRNFDRSSAARFSFLMSIPVMIAAGGMSLLDLKDVPNLSSFLPVLIVGFVVAGIVGYLSIHWLLGFVKKRSLVYFAAYCALLAIAVLVVSNIRGSANVNSLEQTPLPAEASTEMGVTGSQNGNTVTLVEYTASLDWLKPVMTNCANQKTGISLVTHLVAGTQSQPSEGAVLFHWGEPAGLTHYSAQIGIDYLKMVVNPANPLVSLTPEMVQQLYGGKYTSWDAVYQTCPECFESQPGAELASQSPILNYYSSGEEVQSIFDQKVMANTPITRATALLIPSAVSMREAVAGSIATIGYLPSGAIDNSVRSFALTGLDDTLLSFPILAISNTEPQGSTSQLLSCIQQALNY